MRLPVVLVAVGLVAGCAASAPRDPVSSRPPDPASPPGGRVAAPRDPAPQRVPASPPPIAGARPAPTAAPIPERDVRARFAAARARLASGDAAGARIELESLRPRYPELDDYVLDDLGRAAAAAGDATAAEAYWAELLDAHPRSVLVPRAQLARGRSQAARGAAAEAAASLAIARDAGDATTALAASLALADLALARGDPAAAHAYLMAARQTAPGTPLARDAKRRALALRAQMSQLAPTGRDLERELRLLLLERDYETATVTADALLARADEPRWLRARADAEYGAGRVDESLATLRVISARYPRTPEAADAEFRYASVLWNRDRNDEAGAAFGAFLARYPGHARRAEALYALARIAQSAGRDEDAVAAYERLITAAPASPQAREARGRIGWIRYQQGDWQRAALAFASAAQGRGAAEAPEPHYWRARALERDGQREAAEQIYRRLLAEAPGSYYSHWAEQRLGAPAPARHQLTAWHTPPALGAPPPGADPYHWVRARELHAIGLRHAAFAEMRAFERDHAGQPAVADALPSAYQAVGGYRDAIRLASARGSGDPDLLYPLAFWDEVSRAAQGERIDPLLVVALMRQESLFDPSARSPADARGLMQLLPSTADRVARQHGMPSPTDQLYQPETNVALGVTYLGELLRRYGGDPLKAFAAYNGGEQAVARWQERYGHLPPDEFVESITYRETRDYVKRVIGNYRRYQQLYAR
ncbi:MAG: transglycosylase SLT domain-containing protein [Candidatus Binatia bacterium]